MRPIIVLLLSAGWMLQSCTKTARQPLPEIKEVDRAFGFVNQDSQLVNNSTFAGKVYVTDFFFTTCPTICPVMKSQMVLIYEAFKDKPGFALLSHTIDVKHDSVPVLKAYASALGVETEKWHFVTGERDEVYGMAEHYMITAGEEAQAPGGFIHSGAFILVDGNRKIRGYYDGTDPEAVQKLMADIEFLLDGQ